jgi:DNA-binding CsgD family transcriptional regulator
LTLDELIRVLDLQTTATGLWRTLIAFTTDHKISMISYHHYAPGFMAQDDLSVRAEGFPDGWVCRYLEARLFVVDPIPTLALSRATPFQWPETANLAVLDDKARDYLAEMDAAGLGDGLAIPVFGPDGRNGYVGLGFGAPMMPLSLHLIGMLQAAAQYGHLCYCRLVTTEAVPVRARLSPPEREVLDWIARGKSNAVIAQILGISRHTVGMLVRRIFHKMGVNDRVSAAVRGVGGARVR